MRRMILSALRGDKELIPTIAESLRQRLDGTEEGRMTTMFQAAEALEPVIAEAVKRKPSKLAVIGLKSTHLLASLAAEDREATGRLAALASNQVVGIAFVDIEDFTRFTAERGDDAAIAVLQRLNELTRRAVKASKGEVVKSLGDGFLLAFPSASQAVRAAVSLQREARAARSGNGAFPVALRIAVHAGEPLIEGDDMLGHDVNLTARLLDHCRPDEVVVSEPAKELAEKRLRRVAFRDRRRVKIRGLATKVLVYKAEPVAQSQ